jgi:Asp/Glu/hydantoin racemase
LAEHHGAVSSADDPRVQALLGRAFTFADEDLSGINEAAMELARVAGGDVAVIGTAIRWTRGEVRAVGDRRTKQVASLLRRALEIGEWDWASYEQTHG